MVMSWDLRHRAVGCDFSFSQGPLEQAENSQIGQLVYNLVTATKDHFYFMLFVRNESLNWPTLREGSYMEPRTSCILGKHCTTCTIPQSFCSNFVFEIASCKFCWVWPRTWDLPALVIWVARIIGVHHNTWLHFFRKVLMSLLSGVSQVNFCIYRALT
jgi:hypothetical protein